MQFLKSVAICASALAAFAAAQSTQVAIYNMPDTVQVGKATQLQIHSGNGPFTLTLRRGNPNDLQNVSTITTTGTGSSYSWIPDPSLQSGSDYAIMISQGDQSNYTPEFTIAGGKAAGSSSSPGSYGSGSSSAAASTFSTAAKTSAASNCAVTQIGDGQPQAPPGCTSSSSAAAVSASSTPTYAASNSTAAGPSGVAYSPLPGNTGSPASSNTTVPTYSVPSPTSGSSSSGSGSSSGSQSSAQAPKQTGGAAQIGSSLALIAGAVAAFAFLN